MILLRTYSSNKESEVPRDMRPQNRNVISSDTDFGSRAIIEYWNVEICILMVLNFTTGEEPLKKFILLPPALLRWCALLLNFSRIFILHGIEWKEMSWQGNWLLQCHICFLVIRPSIKCHTPTSTFLLPLHVQGIHPFHLQPIY